jgi:hypothetical protein
MQTGALITVPARRGRALRIGAGDSVQIINTHGKQRTPMEVHLRVGCS